MGLVWLSHQVAYCGPGKTALTARELSSAEETARIRLSLPPERRTPVATISDVTDSTFEEEVLKSDQPVLVDFWAEWCAPCRMMAPVLKEIADEFGDRIRVCKLDVDANPNSAARFNIRSIPSLLFFQNGQVADQVVGAVPKARIVEKLDQLSA
jgi:thioredoxin 1